MLRRAEAWAALCALALCGLAQAQDAATPRPAYRGPVTITADTAEWQENGVTQYRGNVRLVTEQFQFSGNRMELRQLADGQFDAVVEGNPALLTHTTPTAQGETPAKAQNISARAQRLSYNSASGIAELSGNARLTRGADEIAGESIRYNVAERRIQAAGSNGSQVKIIIQPPEPAPE
jgi:lipopolysaccharide export system protein LptA